MVYKIVWKVNKKVVPFYYGVSFKTKKQAEKVLKKNIIGRDMLVRKR